MANENMNIAVKSINIIGRIKASSTSACPSSPLRGAAAFLFSLLNSFIFVSSPVRQLSRLAIYLFSRRHYRLKQPISAIK
jgi:hypothetical protein